MKPTSHFLIILLTITASLSASSQSRHLPPSIWYQGIEYSIYPTYLCLERICTLEEMSTSERQEWADKEVLTIPDYITTPATGPGWDAYETNTPYPVEVIMETAFLYRAEKLKEINLPNTIRRIESYAFQSCVALETLRFGAGLKNISCNFYQSPDLKLVYCYSVMPPAIESGAFINPSEITLHVPKGCKDAYEQHECWGELNPIIDDLEVAALDYIMGDDGETSSKPIYNLRGICLSRRATPAEIDALPAGVYIIGGRKVVKH